MILRILLYILFTPVFSHAFTSSGTGTVVASGTGTPMVFTVDSTAPAWGSVEGITNAVDEGTGGDVHVYVNACTDPSTPITYTAYYAPTSTWNATFQSNSSWNNSTLGWIIDSLTDDTEYTFGITCKDSAGNENSTTVTKVQTPTSPPSTYTNNFYVSEDGLDTNSGLTELLPWETVAKINDYADATGFQDDTAINFKRGETFDGETIGHHDEDANGVYVDWGTIDGLTFQPYGTGAKPILAKTEQAIMIHGRDGTLKDLRLKDLDVSGGGDRPLSNGNLVEIYETDGVIVDGLYGDGFAYGQAIARQGVQLTNCMGVLVARNNEIFNQGPTDMPQETDDFHNFHVRNHQSNEFQISSLDIYDNHFYNANGDNIQVANLIPDTVDGRITIYDNLLTHYGENAIDVKHVGKVDIYNNIMDKGGFGPGGTGSAGSGIVTKSFSTDFPNSPRPEDNHYYNNWFRDPGYSAMEITYCRDCEFNGNLISGTGYGGFRITKMYDSSIYDNVFRLDTNGASCIATECSGIRRDGISTVDGNTIEKNTFYLDTTDMDYGIAWYVGDTPGETNNIQNNIFHLAKNDSGVYPFYSNSDFGDQPTLSNNIYYNADHANRVSWDGTVYDDTEQAGFRAEDAGALFGVTPVYNDAANGDYSLDYDATSGEEAATLYGATQGEFYIP